MAILLKVDMCGTRPIGMATAVPLQHSSATHHPHINTAKGGSPNSNPNAASARAGVLHEDPRSPRGLGSKRRTQKLLLMWIPQGPVLLAPAEGRMFCPFGPRWGNSNARALELR